jgi:bacterioferritin-associated ferredoxin
MRELRNTLGVASQCGKCGTLARDIVRDSLGSMAVGVSDQLYYAVG